MWEFSPSINFKLLNRNHSGDSSIFNDREIFYVVDVFELNLNKNEGEIQFFKAVLRFFKTKPCLEMGRKNLSK